MRRGLARGAVVALVVAIAAVVLVFAGAGVGLANDRDEATMTAQVSSADHEVIEGYFTLGDSTTVIAKPGSELYKFLARHRGKHVRITLTEAAAQELSRLER